MRRIVCCAVLLALAAVSAAEAQWKRPGSRDRHREFMHSPVEFGVRGGFDFDDRVGSAGAQVRIPLVRQLPLVPSGDVFFGEAGTEWQLNVDLLAIPDGLGGLYGGVGAAFANRDFNLRGDDEVEAGYNLVLGLDGRRMLDSRVRPFVEARWTDIEEYSPFRIVAGINVPVR